MAYFLGHPVNPPLSPTLVLQMAGWLPVDADGGEVEYRSGAAHHVKRNPHVAERVAKLPDGVVHLYMRTQKTSQFSTHKTNQWTIGAGIRCQTRALNTRQV